MKKNIAIFAFAALGAAANAVVIDTYPDWDGNVTSGWAKVAQSFTAPDSLLTSYKFATAAGQSNITFSVHTWDDSIGETSGALYSTTVDNTAGGDVTVSGINLGLTTGQLYAVVLDLNGNTGQSVHFQTNQASYTGGDASWYDGSGWQFLNSNWNTKFTAEFAVPEPGTIAAFGLGGLALLLRKRRTNR